MYIFNECVQKHIIINRVNANLGGVGARNGGRREDKLEDSIVNAREVA